MQLSDSLRELTNTDRFQDAPPIETVVDLTAINKVFAADTEP